MSHRRIALIGAPIVLAVALGVTTLAARGTAPAPNAAVRVLVYHDMEGLAGQDDWKTYLFSHPEKYPEGQKMLAADLNAVIDGLFAGGATQVDVVDAHGSGNPEQRAFRASNTRTKR